MKKTPHCFNRGTDMLPVGMWGGKHELEFYNTCVVLQLSMLHTVQFISDVCSPHVHLSLLKTKPQRTCMWGTCKCDKMVLDWDHCSSHLKSSHPDHLITVVEKVGQDIKNGRLRKDEFLQRKIPWLHIWPICWSSNEICNTTICLLPAGSQCRTGARTYR